MAEDNTPWMQLLRELFGDSAEDALAELRRMGMDPEALAASTGVSASPAMMDHVLQQIRALVSQSEGQDVNWNLAHDVARGVAAQGGDPTITAAVASEYRAAVSRAELWLDAVTDFNPSTLPSHVWSRAEWVEATLPMWKQLSGPVAQSVSQALSGVLAGAQEMDPEASALLGGQAAKLMNSVSPTVCGMHVGHAAGAMAREAFGATDLGFPLLPEPRVAMIPSGVEQFAQGLDIDVKDVQSFVALREAAHVRLFNAAPWLPGQLHAAIGRYAAGITIDLDALDSAVRDAGAGDPAAIQAAMSTGIFTSHHSDEQRSTLAGIETLVALIEGWVDEVTLRAGMAHLPSIGALREMMRRRRAAGGPAEDTFATLLGLELRPRKLREASALWARLTREVGPDDRDAVWSHPDLLPTAEDLEDVDGWLARRAATDDVDVELRRWLSDEPDGAGDADGTER
jgi:putative hydrolase